MDRGADILKPKLNDGLTSIHFAASNNDIHLLDFIFRQCEAEDVKRIVNITNNDGWTPAHYAGTLNKFDALNILLEHGADLSIENSNLMSCFDEVVRNDHSELFECLWPYAKKIRRDLDKQGSFGFIHLAAGQEGSKTLKVLLAKCKESPNQICNNHDLATPLHFAILS